MPRYAAIDIGSNSVRMLVADARPDGETETLASDRRVTRLGESVFREGRVSAKALDAIREALTPMTAAIRKFDVSGIRAVATSAVRDTSNQAEFLEAVSRILGCRVEVISGLEEARLIHLGVQSKWPHPRHRVLMIDVGGGSAEVIDSNRGERREAFSKPLGAVRLREVFLKKDPPEMTEISRMERFIEEKLAPCLAKIGVRKFDRAIGTSATAAAIVCAVHRIPRSRREYADRMRATLPQVRKLYKDLIRKDLAARSKVTGVGPSRAEIIIPGAAVFLKAMETFQVPSLFYSGAGVRDGIIADLSARGVGRERSMLDRDQRRVVEQMARKYGVSVPHARQVAELAHRLFESLQPLHRLPPEAGRLLEAASYLHDVGHYISDSAHHRHSAYVVQNSGMPGFTDSERQIIALLCRFHRKSMPGAQHDNFQALPGEQKQSLLMLLPLLRLADSLDRSHSQGIEHVVCRLNSETVVVDVVGARPDLDLWAAERVADVFHQVYGKTLELRTNRIAG
jgi:exopolyphosphatase/guanosine-5'-triphosphate,3'-diphosphate pyrophosphatase